MKKTIRIVVVGDEGVGKTSLIAKLIDRSFPDRRTISVMPLVTIPDDIPPQGVTCEVVDTSSREQDVHAVDEDLSRADAVILLFDSTNSSPFDRVRHHWLPRIRAQTRGVPVILVGNKVDRRTTPIDEEQLPAIFSPITNAFKEVECCAECSAKDDVNVREVFYLAMSAALYPLHVLVEMDEEGAGDVAAAQTASGSGSGSGGGGGGGGGGQRLREACKRAFARIFRLCDEDCDGLLNDAELLAFQRRVFGTGLTSGELSSIKAEVAKCEGGLLNDALTDIGFVHLHRMLITNGRMETVWSVLREFGYTDELRLDVEPPVDLRAPLDSVAELTDAGERFIGNLYRRFDGDVAELFATAPAAPFVAVDQRQFLAQWAALMHRDWQQALRMIAYVGGDHDLQRASIRFIHKNDIRHRTVFVVKTTRRMAPARVGDRYSLIFESSSEGASGGDAYSDDTDSSKKSSVSTKRHQQSKKPTTAPTTKCVDLIVREDGRVDNLDTDQLYLFLLKTKVGGGGGGVDDDDGGDGDGDGGIMQAVDDTSKLRALCQRHHWPPPITINENNSSDEELHELYFKIIQDYLAKKRSVAAAVASSSSSSSSSLTAGDGIKSGSGVSFASGLQTALIIISGGLLLGTASFYVYKRIKKAD